MMKNTLKQLAVTSILLCSSLATAETTPNRCMVQFDDTMKWDCRADGTCFIRFKNKVEKTYWDIPDHIKEKIIQQFIQKNKLFGA